MERRWSLWRSLTAREISKQSASYSSSFGSFLSILKPQFSQALEIDSQRDAPTPIPSGDRIDDRMDHLASDTDNRVNHLYVANLRRRCQWNRITVPGTPEATRHADAASRLALTPEQQKEISRRNRANRCITRSSAIRCDRREIRAALSTKGV